MCVLASSVIAVTLSGSVASASDSPTWEQMGEDIDGEFPDDLSGFSVSLSADGTRIAIGGTANDGTTNVAADNRGHVRVFDWNSATSSWVQVGGDIDGEATGDAFGWSVSLSADGSHVAIGADLNDGNGANVNAGHVRVYKWNSATSSWVQVGNDIDGEAAGDAFGSSVSLSTDGSHIAIGARANDGNGISAGHVRVYKWNSATSSWVQVGDDIDGEAAGDESGWSVSLSADGTRVAIGAYLNNGNGISSGHARVYFWTGNAWVKLGSDIDGEAAGDLFGDSVSLSADGTRVAIGASGNDGGGTDSGHVRVYAWRNSSWVQVGNDIDGEAAGDDSGWSVSLSADGSRVAIGAGRNKGNGINAGHVRVYNWDNARSQWVQIGNDIDGEAAGDFSGRSVSLSGDGSRVASGALLNDGNGTDSGHVRIFELRTPTPAPVVPESPASVSTPAALTVAPTPQLYRAANTKVTLRWRAVDGAASYVVTDSRGVTKCSTVETSCTLSRLRNGRSYTYVLYSVNADGVRSTTGTQITARPGFVVKRTSLKSGRSLRLSAIATTRSKGTKTWRVLSGKCRIQGTRLVAPEKRGSCRVRLSTAKSGAYPKMSTTVRITVKK